MHVATLNGVIASKGLCEGLLQQHHPYLVGIRLRVEHLAILAGKLIISLDDTPLPINEQAHPIVVCRIDVEEELLGKELGVCSSE